MDEEKTELTEMETVPVPEVPEEAPAEAPEETRPKLNMRTHYLIRILVGGYLAYLGWQLMQSYLGGTAPSAPVAIIGGVAFLLIGVALVIWSVLLMLRDS